MSYNIVIMNMFQLNTIRLKALFLFTMLSVCLSEINAQTTAYQLLKSEKVSSSIVRLTIKIYCKNKKVIDTEAQYVAVRIALFDGCPDTQYNKPLLEDGEHTLFQQYPTYFEDLYNFRLGDFISNIVRISDFKKADKKGATQYEIDVKVLQLRKDLEKNNIKRKMGI